MKGIILAGGSGTRLYPITKEISKQLLPIYDKPMIYYPLSVLMMAEIKDILIISTPVDLPKFEQLFGDGSSLGLRIKYAIQEKPLGLAQAFTIGEEFIGNDSVAMILGDNIFYGDGLKSKLINAIENTKKNHATIFGYYVKDPERFGVVEFDANGKAISIEEKPENPKSNYAATGLYFYDNKVIDYAKKIKPSARGELEITDINKLYLEDGNLNVETLGRGYSWLDTGTFDSLNEASDFVKAIQSNGKMIGCIEEIAYLNGWITQKELQEEGEKLSKNSYGKYLLKLSNEDLEKDPILLSGRRKNNEKN